MRYGRDGWDGASRGAQRQVTVRRLQVALALGRKCAMPAQSMMEYRAQGDPFALRCPAAQAGLAGPQGTASLP